MSRAGIRKDVTDAEVAERMQPHIAEFMATVSKGGKPKRRPDPAPKQDREPARGKDRETAGLGEEEREYLESVLEQPNLTVTGRRDYLGLSTYMSDRIKKALLAAGLVVEVPVNLGQETRGMVKFLELTEAGYRALGRKPRASFNKASPEHRWWQRNLVDWYRGQGFEARPEMNLNGKRVDVGFVKGRECVAVEVEITPKNAVPNVRQDLDAGFARVLVACKNARVKAAVEERLKPVLTDEQRRRVKVILLAEFSFVKGIGGRT